MEYVRKPPMKKAYIKSIKSKIYDHIAAHFPLLDENKFTLGGMSYTYKCHLNAVQKVKEGKANKVIACVAIDKSTWENIVVHFINQLDDGQYQDNTWGWLYTGWKYYFVKELHPSEYDNIENILGYLQTSLVNDHSNPVMRKLFRVKTIVRGDYADDTLYNLWKGIM